METLLFLSHRLPYPPNKGDKVRSYHLLRHLAQRYRVVLGTFIDDPLDWQHVDALRRWCAEVHIEADRPMVQAHSQCRGRSFWRGPDAAVLPQPDDAPVGERCRAA